MQSNTRSTASTTWGPHMVDKKITCVGKVGGSDRSYIIIEVTTKTQNAGPILISIALLKEM